MIIWGREEQCKDCAFECGCDEPRELLEDGTILYEHEFDCKLLNNCSSDFKCTDFAEIK